MISPPFSASNSRTWYLWERLPVPHHSLTWQRRSESPGPGPTASGGRQRPGTRGGGQAGKRGAGVHLLTPQASEREKRRSPPECQAVRGGIAS